MPKKKIKIKMKRNNHVNVNLPIFFWTLTFFSSPRIILFFILFFIIMIMVLWHITYSLLMDKNEKIVKIK